jgi:glucose-1-phosphate thymidylyltransferase
VKNCEIERSIVLEHSVLCDLNARLQDSLIGRYVTFTRGDQRPHALKVNLGDNSIVSMV